MRKVALVALAVLALGSALARAASGEYSTGNVNARIGAHFDESVDVKDSGPVSFVRVSFRISVPDTSARVSASLLKAWYGGSPGASTWRKESVRT